MPVPMLDLAAQNSALRDQVLEAVAGIIDRSAFVLGPTVDSFERTLADCCGSRHAIGVSSGTDALLAALMAYGIGPGDEVIVPTFTFFATAAEVARVGATPVFVDIDPVTFNIDPAAATAAYTDRTRAIIPVHLFGLCCEIDDIARDADRRGVPVIEDAAQAIGATVDGRQAGTIGPIGCLSFYPTKNLGAFGDAGAILTDDDDLARRLRQIRLHGQTDEYHHEIVGGNFRIDAIQAAVLSAKLPHLAAYAAGRRAAAERYAELLDGLPITLPTEPAGKRHTYNQYTIRCDRRDDLSAHLKSRGIGHKVYYPLPLHMQPCFGGTPGDAGRCPHAERASREVVSLPMFPEITPAQQQETAEAIRSFFD